MASISYVVEVFDVTCDLRKSAGARPLADLISEPKSRAYERGNVYLGESSRALSATHLYEMPAIKANAAAAAKQAADMGRKIEELERSCAELGKQRQARLAELGIAGKNYRAELPLLANGIPALLPGPGVAEGPG